VKREKYTQCTQSKYCTRDRTIDPQKWSVDANSIKTNENSFLAVIDDATYNNKFLLKIRFHGEETVRVRIEPAEKETFNRFDTSSEPTIIDQKFISAQREFKYVKNDANCVLETEKQSVFVQFSPFSVSVMDGNGEAVILNLNDTAVFETHRDNGTHPELFEKNNFNGFEDVFKNGPTSVAMSFRFRGRQNRLTGLPAHTLPLSLPDTTQGEPIRFYNTDINEFEVNNGMSMYGAVPFVLAHSLDRSAGLFWANPSETWVDIKHSEDKEYSDARFISEGGYIDVYVFTGTPKDISDEYTQLTGRPMLAPRFSLAYHQCRWGYMTQEDFMQVSKNLDQVGVPHDVMWLDLDHTDDRKYFTFHPSNFPSPKKMLNEFAKNKRYVVTLVDPHLKAEKSYSVYNTASEKKLLMMNRNGGAYEAHCWPGRSSWPDYMNPATRQWWESLFEFSSYSDSAPNVFIWNDMNEISVFDASDNSCPRDLVHYGDIEEREVHNIYGHMMVTATFGGLRKRTQEPMRPFILSRSFFSGSQRYCVVWSGDNTADWANLKNSVQLVLSFGVGGIVYSGSDVGGFFNSPNDELLSRWFSVAAWSYTFFREHCHHLAARREINLIKSREAQDLSKESIIERYMMLPYWYTLSKESNETGVPIVRPMWYEFNEEQLLDCDDQFMLGSGLLVVPFVEEGTKDRKFKLPKGTWYNFRSLEKHTDDVAKYDKGRTLVLQKAGSIVPMKCRIRKSSELMFYDPFTLVIAVDENGAAEGKLYEDDGKSERFEAGNYVYRQFKVAKAGSAYKLTGESYNEKEGNEFAKTYDVEIERIRIAGIPTKPSNIEGPTGKLDFEYENGVLTIRKPSVLIRDSFEITISE
jgi:alpha 1,3-glucosidase